jgi:hypothetical protein
MHPRSLFSLAEHLERLSKDGAPLEVLAGTVEFERFRPLLTRGLGYRDGAKDGRPAFDPVVMFKVLVVQAQHNLSDARWTVKIGGKIRYRPDGSPLPQIATPVFGYKSHISIDRRFGFIRKAAVTSAVESDGRQLRRVIDTANTASNVWADSACRSTTNEAWLKANMRKQPHPSPQAQGQADP